MNILKLCLYRKDLKELFLYVKGLVTPTSGYSKQNLSYSGKKLL